MTRCKFKLIQFDPARLAVGRLFGREFDEDPWVAFHGTSGSNSAAIEDQGFTYARHPLTSVDLARINDVFVAMNWLGVDPGGYQVLHAFSTSDFGASERSPIFFTERPDRAPMYATRDCAGGEKLRAVRRALADLQLYLSDPSVRVEHTESMEQEVIYLRDRGAAAAHIEAETPRPVELDWLAMRLDSFKPLAEAANRAL